MNKFFNRQFTGFTILFLSLIVVTILSTTVLNSWAIHENEYTQTEKVSLIPFWIKNNAGWWADGEITENDFLLGITFLIDNTIIKITNTSILENADNATDSGITKRVPDWIKNNAGWWAGGQIPDSVFVSGLEWLISNGIIKVDIQKVSLSIEDVIFSSMLKDYDKTIFTYSHSSFFEIYIHPEEFIMQNGIQKWLSPKLALNTNKMNQYNELALWHDTQKVAVVFPIFTSSAYANGGFYDYYRGDCDHCTTTAIKEPILLFTSSGNAVQALTLLGYDLINDIDVDTNPIILKKYDKIIMLHNEYVTRTMFDAITSHPKVVYLYPNALYAEIEVDYDNNTITLIRGHNYPEEEITNGFDWEFDNTRPYEFDRECKTMKMYSIKDPRSGGDVHWMTTCYPDDVFHSSEHITTTLLQAIKDI